MTPSDFGRQNLMKFIKAIRCIIRRSCRICSSSDWVLKQVLL